MRDAFAAGQAADPVGGAQLCVYRHGKVVADLWTGRDGDRDYTADTLNVVMSCTKGATAILANRLAEQGVIDVEAPVARYWPEFAANGKDGLTVAHCLSHTAGLPTFPMAARVGARDLAGWTRCTDVLAAAAPLWTPGAHGSYHAVTYGFLAGEVIRRVTGKSAGRCFADEIAGPLGLDFWIGLPAAEQARVAPHIPQPARPFREVFKAAGVDIDHPVMAEILAGFDAITDTVDYVNTPEGRAAELPAANGVASARALAKMYAACIGDIDGIRLLKPETVAAARLSRTKGLAVLPPMAKLPRPPGEGFGLGFELPNPPNPMLGIGSFGHAGAGGRLGFAHPESGIAAGFAGNAMLWDNVGPDPRWLWLKPLQDIAGTA